MQLDTCKQNIIFPLGIIQSKKRDCQNLKKFERIWINLSQLNEKSRNNESDQITTYLELDKRFSFELNKMFHEDP